MDTGEELAAYAAGDLDADERAAIEAQLARDPALRRRLERIERVDALLAGLPDVTPPDGLRERLDERLRADTVAPQQDELAQRRTARRRVWRPLAIAAAAAAVIAVIGVGAGTIMRGGGGTAEVALDDGAGGEGPAIGPYETDNDYSPQELRRLAVNVDVREVLPSGLTPEEAHALADRYQGELIGVEDYTASRGTAVQESGGEVTTDALTDAGADAAGTAETDAPAYQRCLPELLAGSPEPLIPVYVELARFQGEPAIIYAFASVDPESDTYRRIQVWAVARSDCHVFNYTSYDRE